jgi:hypothetical protein
VQRRILNLKESLSNKISKYRSCRKQTGLKISANRNETIKKRKNKNQVTGMNNSDDERDEE